jgi:hypothetical protein
MKCRKHRYASVRVPDAPGSPRAPNFGARTKEGTGTPKVTYNLRASAAFPRRHRLRIDPQPPLSIPGLLLQILQHRLPLRVLLIPSRQPCANKFLIQVAPIRQDDFGDGALVAVDVADRDHLPEGQVPGELLGARPEWLLHFRAVYPPYPNKRITINLAPANVRKEGAGFDLPVAIGILSAMGAVKALDNHIFIGELPLDGAIRPVRGTLSIAVCAREQGIANLIVPAGNAAEAAVVEGVNVYGLRYLAEVVALLTRPEEF